MKKIPIILVGGGGHCISCIDVVEQTGKYEIIGILDQPEKVGTSILDYKIIGTDNDLEKLVESCKHFLITVGQIKSPEIRKLIHQKIKNAGGILPVISSPTAYVSQHAQLEEGTIVMHQAFVNAGAKVGKCCIINSKALIEHESIVDEFCHISTAACINGQVTVGKDCFIGSNSVLANNISVPDTTKIAAGSFLSKSMRSSGTYLGNPARKIK